MKGVRIELYYKDGRTKTIWFEEPIFQWYRHMGLQGLRPVGLNVFVGEHLCRYKAFIIEHILKHKKGIVMGMHPDGDCMSKTKEYLSRLEQELKERCYE